MPVFVYAPPPQAPLPTPLPTPHVSLAPQSALRQWPALPLEGQQAVFDAALITACSGPLDILDDQLQCALDTLDTLQPN